MRLTQKSYSDITKQTPPVGRGLYADPLDDPTHGVDPFGRANAITAIEARLRSGSRQYKGSSIGIPLIRTTKSLIPTTTPAIFSP